MNSQTSHIEEVAQLALNKVKPIATPVPVEEIAKAFELEVVEFPFHNNISGLLKKDEGVIGVNKGQAPSRRRFTIAHELGHFLLGHGLEANHDGEIVDGTFDKPLPVEREANLFASALLMPRDLIQVAVKNNGLDLDKLSDQFGVSKQAMTIRLMALKLI